MILSQMLWGAYWDWEYWHFSPPQLEGKAHRIQCMKSWYTLLLLLLGYIIFIPKYYVR